MAIAEQVIIDLIARTDSLERGFRQARQETGALSRGVGALKASIGAIGFGLLAREALQYAEAYKQINAQLKLATAASGNLAQAQKDVRQIAEATRSGLTETASLYGNFVRATQQLGGTQDQAARATETFSKALKIGGADANAAASATLQFGQALASGVLRGDEFNSIAEASPRILKLLADAMGVSQGAVRKLAEEGKLTSDVLFRALTERKFTAGIDAEFKSLPPTVAQAFSQVENAAIDVFGKFDEGGEFSTTLADFISRGARGFGDLADAALEEGQNIRAAFAGLGDVFEPLFAGASGVFSGIRRDANYTRDSIQSILSGLDNVYNAYAKANNVGTRIENAYTRGFNFVTGSNIKQSPLLRTRNSARDFRQSYDNQRAESDNAQFTRDFYAKFGGADRLGAILRGDVDVLGNSRRQKPRPPKPDGKKTTKGRLKAGGSKKPAFNASEFAFEVQKDAYDAEQALARLSITDKEYTSRLANNFRDIIGTEGTDFADPFAGVKDNDRRVEQEGEERQRVNDMLANRQRQDIQSLAQLYQSAFQGGVKGIWQEFKQQGLAAIALVLAQLAVGKSLKEALGSATGPDAGSIFSAIGNVFAKRAGGGNVVAGQVYQYNDDLGNRKELFRPSQSGTIYPTGSLQARGGGGGVTVVAPMQFDLRGAVTTPQLMAQFNRISQVNSQRAAAAAGKAAYDQSPTRLSKRETLGT